MLHSLLVWGLWAAPALGHPIDGDTLKQGVAQRAAIVPDSIYAKSDVAPQYVGGSQALSAFLQKNIRVPEKAMRQRISGTVYISFVVNEKGRITDAHVVRGPGYGLNEEALRIVWLMPSWQPGTIDGQPVRVVCTIPIAFAN